MAPTVYRNFDEFADKIAGVEGRFVPTAPSSADWWVHGTQIHRISLQQLQIGGSSTFAGGGQHDRITLGLPMTNAKRMRIDGSELQDDCFIFMNQGQPFCFAGTGVTTWAGLTVPFDHPNLDAATIELVGAGDSVRTRTLLMHLERLRWLVNRLMCTDSTVGLANPVAAATAEQEISLAIAYVLQFSSNDPESQSMRWRLPRARAIARCLDLIEASQGRPLHIEDLCRAANMGERTLRNVFLENFGISPMRLLRVKQLCEARAALLSAHPGRATLTEIVEPLGIWDFSLFAGNYKALFQELPSKTLQLPVSSSGANPSPNWLVYAAQNFRSKAIANQQRSIEPRDVGPGKILKNAS